MTSSRTSSWLLTVGAIAIAGILLSVAGLGGPLRSVTGVFAAPLEGMLNHLTSPLVDLVGHAGSYGTMRDENRDLRVENERLRADTARLREDQTRAIDVADLLNLRTIRPNDTYALASVIARDPSPGRTVVAINRGSSDGIVEGMVVLGRGGALVGTIERVELTMAWVRLLTDARSDVNALIQESRAQALVSGQPNGAITMQFLAEGVDVRPGDSVVTSGLGGSYPSGLLIGRVAKVEGSTLDLFKRVQIEPQVRLPSVESVAVLTSFQPLKLGAR